MEQSEHVWLAAYRRGDSEALGKLVEHYRRPLFGFILSMTQGQGDAEEIFQEVWFRAIKNLDRYRPKSFLSWLFRIAHNLVIDRARKRKPEASLDENPEGGRPLADRVAARGPDPAAQTGSRDLARRIAAAAEHLPAEQKEVFLLRTRAELPFREIAKIQGVSINTALARMQYALAKLREALREDYEEIRT
ncbi:MAG: sigma-70 family RNA polymerase sigma factor [Kiritimatiellae bacterium]|nr:sigma-70 family RNA polymerase sigma factor [Kiritimatiellia bacterium]